jgi:hypothetical protein
MGCLGRHLALTKEQVEELRAIAEGRAGKGEEEDPEEALWEAIQEIEERLPAKYYQDTDKSWDNIHRALTLDNTPGGRLGPEEGDWPLCLVILGGDHLCEGEDYTVCVVEPDGVAEVAAALHEIDEGWVRKRFFTLDPKAAMYDIDEDNLQYLWGWLRPLADFFARAAGEGRFVLFTVSL